VFNQNYLAKIFNYFARRLSSRYPKGFAQKGKQSRIVGVFRRSDKDIQKIKDYQKEYREKNREKRNAQMRQYYNAHKEEFREHHKKYRQENKERITAQQKEYYEVNRDIILKRMQTYHKKYYVINREQLLEKNRVHVKQNREKYTQYQKGRRIERQKWLQELKNGLSCIICGESDPACLDFHHRDSSVKKGLISKMVTRVSMERVMDEIDKCDVLCANCHRKLHAKVEM
jgi:hypothetical protein